MKISNLSSVGIPMKIKPFLLGVFALAASTIITGATPGVNVLLFAGLNYVAGQLPGTKTNDNAAAGNVGEFVTATAGPAALTTNTAANVASISLTPGDWSVWATLGAGGGTTTTVNWTEISVSSSSAVISPTIGQTTQFPSNGGIPFAFSNINLNVEPVRFSLSTTTTVYCVAEASFSISTLSAYCNINARRVR